MTKRKIDKQAQGTGLGLSICRDIVEAADGEEALRLLKDNQFDLVFLDWNLPKADGLEVLKSIRAGRSTVPVIMVTVESERVQILKAIHAGASDYLIKPFAPDTLIQKLEKHCPARSAGRAQ